MTGNKNALIAGLFEACGHDTDKMVIEPVEECSDGTIFKVCFVKDMGNKCLQCVDAAVIDCEVNLMMWEYLKDTETWD